MNSIILLFNYSASMFGCSLMETYQLRGGERERKKEREREREREYAQISGRRKIMI